MIWWPTEVPTLKHGLITLRAPQESDIPAIFEGAQDPLIPIFTRIPSNYSSANCSSVWFAKAFGDLSRT